MDIITFILADVSYIAGFIFYTKNRDKNGFYLLIAGLIFHTVSIIGRGLLAGYPPFFSLYEIFIFFSWAIVFLSLSTGFHKVSGKFVALLAWILLGIVCFLNPGIKTLPLELKTMFFPFHVSSCIIGYGAFFIAFMCGVLFLLKRGRVEVYDVISQRAVIIGMLFFSAGIIIGSVWAKKAWGNYWSWDPKETAALISWVIYAGWLCTRLFFSWKGKRSAWLSIAGFCGILFTWFGVNVFFAGLHNYK